MKLKVFKGAKDYNKLQILPFNRKFSVRQDLLNNMNKDGFTPSRPIDLIKTDIFSGKLEDYMADGQNRATTAAFLNIEFYGIVTKTILAADYDSIDDAKKEIVEYVARLNTGQKAWKAINYVDSFAYLGYEEYNKLIMFTNKCPFSVETVAGLLYGVRGRGHVTNKLKDGTFKCNLGKETKYTLSLVAKLSKHERVTSRMVQALHYVSMTKSFNEDKFIETYKLKAKEVKELKLDDYTDVFSSWI